MKAAGVGMLVDVTGVDAGFDWAGAVGLGVGTGLGRGSGEGDTCDGDAGGWWMGGGRRGEWDG